MRYIEVTLNTPPGELDARCQELTEMGVEGFVIENEEDFKSFLEQNRQVWDYVDSELERRYAGVSRIKCYFTDDVAGLALLSKIRAVYPQCTYEYTPDKDWENAWREEYAPIKAGERLVVVPSWLEAPDEGRTPLFVEPGIAFGAGSHPTTHMCLAALENYAKTEARFLDLGCGNGILGIAALVLGAAEVKAVDIDPKAVNSVMLNASLNELDESRIKVYSGDILTDASLRRSLGAGYDVVLANIVADVIIALCPLVRSFMAEDGVFICSGVIDNRQKEVEAALVAAGFTIIERRSEEEWREFTCI